MKSFMDVIVDVVRLQSWWRMLMIKRHFAAWRAERNAARGLYFIAWKSEWLVEKMRMRLIGGYVFRAWRDEVADRKRLGALALEFFKISVKRSRLSAQVLPYHGQWGLPRAHTLLTPANLNSIVLCLFLFLFLFLVHSGGDGILQPRRLDRARQGERPDEDQRPYPA